MYDPLSNMSPGPACSILTPSQCPGEHSVCVSEIYLEDKFIQRDFDPATYDMGWPKPRNKGYYNLN